MEQYYENNEKTLVENNIISYIIMVALILKWKIETQIFFTFHQIRNKLILK